MGDLSCRKGVGLPSSESVAAYLTMDHDRHRYGNIDLRVGNWGQIGKMNYFDVDH
jgi:hypothetical protein